MHLLLTDVVMPGRGGRELAALLHGRDPRLRIVFMSGYPDQEPFLDGPGLDDAFFLPKPFDRTRLLATVRKALDARREADAAAKASSPSLA